MFPLKALGVVRHGNTTKNDVDRFRQLTELGARQADEVGKRLNVYPFDAIFCSAVDRTMQTAARIQMQMGTKKPPIIALEEIYVDPQDGGMGTKLEEELFVPLGKVPLQEYYAHPKTPLLHRFLTYGTLALMHLMQKLGADRPLLVNHFGLATGFGRLLWDACRDNADTATDKFLMDTVLSEGSAIVIQDGRIDLIPNDITE